MKTAIDVIDVSFSYPDKADVLKEINLTVREGESLGVIGPNGAGKTTFFHILCGVLKPVSGKVLVFGEESQVNKFNPEIGYIFQNPDDQLYNTTVSDDVAFGPLNMGLDKEEVKERVEYALEITNCTGLANRPPHHLSGGEKRMVAIATVLSMKPRIVIYDEPTSNLDMRSRRKLIDFVNSSNETMLIASHDLEFVLETCKKVVVLDKGELVVQGEIRAVMNDEICMLRHGLERPHSLLHDKNHRH